MESSIEDVCLDLLGKTEASTIMIALLDERTNQLQWRYAVKPLNERYRRMHIGYGKGVAGKVIQTGRVWSCESREQLPSRLGKYPIVLSEQLQSFVAIPLRTDRLFGAVLLIGYRTVSPLPSKQIWGSYAERLTNMLIEKEAYA
ncbi:GAF domain-containing protein [Halobacillus locisalis]|uniref:GAF domain-containing protein n=1 Tax=Halobacillus locisalis TaxID=220753 RepID=A0A838CSR7_9BACI|nr:GAF domain-containing protein [Halobacillus locisalis]MBA2174991.1 GAF domain-containing protein [Halobacillus locisalis]